MGSLVASHNMFEAERLLTDYVLTRRNALSSTAAIEYALIKVSSRPACIMRGAYHCGCWCWCVESMAAQLCGTGAAQSSALNLKNIHGLPAGAQP